MEILFVCATIPIDGVKYCQEVNLKMLTPTGRLEVTTELLDTKFHLWLFAHKILAGTPF